MLTARKLKVALDFLPEEALDLPIIAELGTTGIGYGIGHPTMRNVTPLIQGGPGLKMKTGDQYISLYIEDNKGEDHNAV